MDKPLVVPGATPGSPPEDEEEEDTEEDDPNIDPPNVGDKIRIQKLEFIAGMNGKIGTVEGPDGIRPGIFKVKLEETGKVVGIRKMNMDFIERHVVEEEESDHEPPQPPTPEEPMPTD